MGEQQLTGPDLALGIAEDELGDGAMLGGHSQGESVLLVRRGDEIFAIGGTCTHYSGPLAEGIVTDNFVRCPWHHACFDLRSGEAVRAPALAPVPVWRVERIGGRIYVQEKVAPAPKKAGPGPLSVTILGAGAAGVAVADTLRREGYAGEIFLISRERDLPFDKPNLSKDYLAGKAPADWIPLHSREYYEERSIRLLLGAEVTAIDIVKRQLTFADGRNHPFVVLVIATGAAPRRLNVPGAQLPHVHYLRTFADSRAISRAASASSRAVIVGSSFIGLEVAASLRERGVHTTVVSPDDVPLGRVFGAELGNFVRGLHEEHGVEFRLGQTIQSIHPSHVVLSNGDRMPSDLVIVGIGVVPEVTLAQQAGLQLGNGVLVNEQLETSHPGIFAAGDLANWPDRHSRSRLRVEHWVVAGRQGQTVARNILGHREKFTVVPFFWSQHYDAVIAYIGHASNPDQIIIDGSLAARDATIVFREAGRVAAVATIFRDRINLEVEASMEAANSEGLEQILAGDSRSEPSNAGAAVSR